MIWGGEWLLNKTRFIDGVVIGTTNAASGANSYVDLISVKGPSTPSSVPSSSTPSSVPSSSNPSSVSSSSSSVASSNCLSYSLGDRAELNLTNTKCVDLNVNLSGKSLALWDSDVVNCDFKGTVTSVNGTGSVTVDSTYEKSTSMTGTRLQFNSTGNCPYIKMRVY